MVTQAQTPRQAKSGEPPSAWTQRAWLRAQDVSFIPDVSREQ